MTRLTCRNYLVNNCEQLRFVEGLLQERRGIVSPALRSFLPAAERSNHDYRHIGQSSLNGPEHTLAIENGHSQVGYDKIDPPLAGVMQCLRKLDSVDSLRLVVTDRSECGSCSCIPSGITRIHQSVLESVFRKPLHAAVRQTHIALLRMHVIQPADGGV